MLPVLNAGVNSLEIKQYLLLVGPKILVWTVCLLDFTSSTCKICEDDICAIVNDCFLTASLPKGSNDTLIALVSKVDIPIEMSQS